MAGGNLSKSVSLRIVADAGDAKDRLDDIMGKVEEIDGKKSSILVNVHSGTTKEQLDEITEKADALGIKNIKFRVVADTGASAEKLKALDKGLADIGPTAKAAAVEAGESFEMLETKFDWMAAKAKAAGAEASAAVGDVGKSAVVAGDETSVAGDKAVVSGEKMATSAEIGAKAWKATKFAILGIAVAAGVGIDQAAKFQQKMELVHTQAGLSTGAVKQLSSGVLDLAGKVGENPDSLAEAAYHVASNMGSMGATSTQMLSAVKVAAEGARVGQANLVDVTNALGAAIASGIPGVQNYQSAMGVLNATVGAGDMTMQNLADAMGTGFLANVKLYGSTLTDTGAALATFGDNNIRGAAAGTEFRMAVQAIAVQAKSAKPALDQLGLSAGQLGKFQAAHGTVATIDLISQKLKAAKIPAAEYGKVITDLFGKKAGSGIGVLIDQVGRLDSKQKALGGGAAAFGKAWKAQQQTVSQQFADFKQGSDALVISLGAALLPTAIKVMGVLNKFVQFLEAHKTAGGGLMALIGGIAGVLAMKKAADGIKGIVEATKGITKYGGKAFSLLGKGITQLPRLFGMARLAAMSLWETLAANPIILIITAVIIVVLLIIKYHKQLGEIAVKVWHAISGAALAVYHDILKGFDTVFGYIKAHWPMILGILTGPIGIAVVEIVKHWKSIEHGFMAAFDSIRHFFARVWSDIVTGVLSGINKQITYFRALPGRILHAVGDLGKLLWNEGTHIITGLISGIESKAGDLIGEAKSLAGKLLGPFKGVLGIFSPSKEFAKLGAFITQGLTNGIISTKQKAVDASRNLATEIRNAFSAGELTTAQYNSLMSKLTNTLTSKENSVSKYFANLGLSVNNGILTSLETGTVGQVAGGVNKLLSQIRTAMNSKIISTSSADTLSAYLTKQNKTLTAIATQRSTIANTIKTANAYAVSVSKSVLSNDNITSAASGTTSAGGIVANLSIDVHNIRAFAAGIKRLKQLGLNGTFLDQIIQAGPDSGLPLVQELLAGPLSDIKSINRDESALKSASTGLGQTAANVVYDTGKEAGKGFLSGLKAQEKTLDSMMQRLGKTMVKTVESGLRASSATSTKNVVNVTVQGIVGDAGATGKQIAQALNTYLRQTGQKAIA